MRPSSLCLHVWPAHLLECVIAHYYYYYYFFDPGTQFPRKEKITLCNIKKYKNQAGMNLTPPPPPPYYYYYYYYTPGSIDPMG